MLPVKPSFFSKKLLIGNQPLSTHAYQFLDLQRDAGCLLVQPIHVFPGGLLAVLRLLDDKMFEGGKQLLLWHNCGQECPEFVVYGCSRIALSIAASAIVAVVVGVAPVPAAGEAGSHVSLAPRAANRAAQREFEPLAMVRHRAAPRRHDLLHAREFLARDHGRMLAFVFLLGPGINEDARVIGIPKEVVERLFREWSAFARHDAPTGHEPEDFGFGISADHERLPRFL